MSTTLTAKAETKSTATSKRNVTINKRKPTLKQQRFAQLLPTAKSATQAAIAAGYSPTSARESACETLANSNVQPLIQAQQASLQAQAEITAVQIIRDLADDAQGARGANQWAASIRARELIGKQLGMFADRVQLEILDRRGAEFARLVADVVRELVGEDLAGRVLTEIARRARLPAQVEASAPPTVEGEYHVEALPVSVTE